jgi:S1-C subfamily serine protease
MKNEEEWDDNDVPKKLVKRKKTYPGNHLDKILLVWTAGIFVAMIAAAMIANSAGKSKRARTSEDIAHMLDKITVSVCTKTMTQAGIVVGPKIVLTNLHILNNGGTCIIKGSAPNRFQYQATVMRSDPINDLVLLQVQTNQALTPARLGNSDFVDRGDIIYSMGKAYGKSNFFTYGMISDNNFNFASQSGNLCGMFRTNIYVYDGTCGSPLMNIRGEVIGINTSVAYPNNQFTGIGYATPINKALALLQNRQSTPAYATQNPYTPQPANGFGSQSSPYSLA